MSLGERKPKVSVIVVNAKGTKQLEECLRALMETDYPNYDVTVVDCLTTGISEWMRERFPDVRLIHFDHDIGASASHNVEEKTLDPEVKYLSFLDNDAVVTKSWLRELVNVMESDETIGMAQAKIILAKDRRILDHAGIALDALGTWYTTRGMREDKPRRGFEIFAASSAACIVRREVFEEAGGFDPDYFIYDDDTDLSFRIRLLGYKVVFVPSAVVIHLGEQAKALSPRKLYHSVKNRTCTMLKNYELRNLWWRFILYSVLTVMAALILFAMGKRRESKEVFRGILYPIRNVRRVWEKRLRIQAKRRLRDSELLKRGLLRSDIYPTLLDLKSKLRYIKG